MGGIVRQTLTESLIDVIRPTRGVKGFYFAFVLLSITIFPTACGHSAPKGIEKAVSPPKKAMTIAHGPVLRLPVVAQTTYDNTYLTIDKWRFLLPEGGLGAIPDGGGIAPFVPHGGALEGVEVSVTNIAAFPRRLKLSSFWLVYAPDGSTYPLDHRVDEVLNAEDLDTEEMLNHRFSPGATGKGILIFNVPKHVEDASPGQLSLLFRSGGQTKIMGISPQVFGGPMP